MDIMCCGAPIQYVTTMLIDPCLPGGLAGAFFPGAGLDRILRFLTGVGVAAIGQHVA